MCVCMYVCVCMCVHACVYVCTCMHTCVCMCIKDMCVCTCIIALFISTHQIKEEVLSSMRANFGKRLKIVNVGKYDVYA